MSGRPTRGVLKRKIAAGERVCGVMLAANSPAIVELLGLHGFDFVLIDMQHTPISFREVEELVRAAQVVGMSALVRVPRIDEVDILKALDIGADGLVLPFIMSAADVEEAVHRVYYHPTGSRSICSQTRTAGYGTTLGAYADRLRELNDGVVLVGVIEDIESLDRIEEMLAIEPGLDAIALGRGDLANALGVAGNQSDPTLLGLIKRSVTRINELARSRTTPCALAVFTYSRQEIGTWAADGATFFCHMSETSFLASEARNYRDSVSLPEPVD